VLKIKIRISTLSSSNRSVGVAPIHYLVSLYHNFINLSKSMLISAVLNVV